MESSKKQKVIGSASSLTDDLFGAKDSSQPSKSSGIFSSIFPHPSMAVGRKSPTSDLMGSLEKHSFEAQTWKKAYLDITAKSQEWGTIFQDRTEPCPLSSSLHYGSQEDMYIKSSDAQSLPNYKKKEDDPSGNNLCGAPGGNWWDGSVYY